MSQEPIRAVLFDLDDTLFLQETWLAGAWRAVAAAGGRTGLDAEQLHGALVRVAAAGSARGHIIDDSLAEIGAPTTPLDPLLRAFREHRAVTLPLMDGVTDALARVRARVPIGLVTDGDPRIQHGKIASLGLDDTFDVVVFSDALGRARRKPDPAPYRNALEALGVAPEAAAFVGDRPETDMVGAIGVGLRAVRVRTGEYRDRPDVAGTCAVVDDVPAAVSWLEPQLAGP